MLPWNEVLIIIPTYNEAKNIKRMVLTLKSLYPLASILIVDDMSPDGTARVVKAMLRREKELYLIEREGIKGLANAYVEGLRWALKKKYNYIFQMDGDFSHDPSQLETLLGPAQTHDLVIGSRYIEKTRTIDWSFWRLILSRAASIYIRLITALPLKDPMSGLKCFTRQALEKIDWGRITSRGHIFQLELHYKLFLSGAKIKEVPIPFYGRKEGSSKMNGKIIWEAFVGVLKFRLYAIADRWPQ
ncbi:MAG: polyprenol monophosphomannose synthase [Bacteriovoracales bacterium]|nr:polyprenol monophosphomannose synthase [Bacteriovoracales bacterium]